MPDENDRADSLRLYLTGASSDGGAQADPDASLGDRRSSTEFEPLGIAGAHVNVSVDFASGANGIGDGTLQSDGAGNLRWTAPGSSTPGEYVAVGDTETKVLEDGEDAAKYIRVTRNGTTPPAGTEVVQLMDVFNSLFDNVADAEHQAGDDEYRCLCFKNGGPREVQGLKVWLRTLGTARLSNAAQLGGSGAGTLGTTGSFADWPDSGFVRIVDNAGALREIAFYISRSDTVLSVPAAGRGLLGTGADAGASTDTLHAVPGIRIAKEAPSSQPSGYFTDKTVAGEGSAPSVAWATPIDEANAVAIGTLAAGNIYGLWIHRHVIVDHAASALVRQGLAWTFDYLI